MEESYRSQESNRVYIWYACRFLPCQQEMLHVTTSDKVPKVAAKEADRPVGSKV